MKNKSNYNRSIDFSTIQKFTLALLSVFVLVSCSKDDDSPDPTITAMSQTFTVEGINNCNTSSGKGSTLFLDIPYTSTSTSKITKLQVKTTVTDGGSKTEANTKFTDKNGIISWATCARFGSQDWMEFEVVLEAMDGSRSNPTTVRVSKPGGAN